jgi:hypothetical protein
MRGGSLQQPDRGERERGADPCRPALGRPAQGAGHRLYQHSPRDRRHGDGRMEADGLVQPASHRGGVQGARDAADSANGAAEEETEIEREEEEEEEAGKDRLEKMILNFTLDFEP